MANWYARAGLNDTPRYVTLRDYLRVVRNHRLVILLAAALFAGLALAYSEKTTPKYRAEAAVAFSDPAQDLSLLGTPVANQQTSEQRSAIGADQVTRHAVVAAVAKDLKFKTTNGLVARVSARPEARTNFVVIDATSTNARQAAAIANAFAREVRNKVTDDQRKRFDEIAGDLRRQYKNGVGVDSTTRAVYLDRVARVEALRDFSEPVSITKTAGVPGSPYSPQTVRNTVLGLLVGLTIGLLFAFGRDALDRRLRTADEASTRFGLPLLGQLSARALGTSAIGKNGHRAFPASDAEAVRILRKNIHHLSDGKPHVLLVTSAVQGEGKSTAALATAAAAARAGEDVLLIECDLRRPSLARRLKVREQPGLADVLAGEIEPDSVGERVDVDGEGAVTVIVAGRPGVSPELLGSVRMAQFMEQARRDHDLVVLDGTPLLTVVDAREVMSYADAVLLCVRASRTTREEARATRSALARLPERPVGIVVTGARGDDVPYGEY
jgi:capsular exopolysaccharide synthesis family protein